LLFHPVGILQVNISVSGPPYVPAHQVLTLGSPAGWYAAPESRCGVEGCGGNGICRVHDPASELSSQHSRERKSIRGGGSAVSGKGQSGGALGGAVTVACACLQGFLGKRCQPSQVPRDASCPLACQGRGTCRFGHCQCQEGSWGPACAYNTTGRQRPGLRTTANCPASYTRPLQYQNQPATASAGTGGGDATRARAGAGLMEALKQLPTLVERLSKRPAGLSIWVYPIPTHVVSCPVFPT
jgi:hypothetical protein